MPNTGFKLLDIEPSQFVFAAWKNVTIFVWAAQATGPAVARLARCTSAVYGQCPEGVSNVHIALTGVGLPTPEAREGFVELMKSRADRRACIAIVIAGEGFWSSALRSFITGMRLVSPRSYQLGMHGSVTDAADWLPLAHATRTGVPLDRRELQRVLLHAQSLVQNDSALLRSQVP